MDTTKCGHNPFYPSQGEGEESYQGGADHEEGERSKVGIL